MLDHCLLSQDAAARLPDVGQPGARRTETVPQPAGAVRPPGLEDSSPTQLRCVAFLAALTSGSFLCLIAAALGPSWAHALSQKDIDMLLKVLGFVCAGVFIGATLLEVKQIRLRRRQQGKGDEAAAEAEAVTEAEGATEAEAEAATEGEEVEAVYTDVEDRRDGPRREED